jgi:hypothetical protein
MIGNLAVYHRERGNYDRAAELIDEGLTLAEHFGNLGNISGWHTFRSTLLLYKGDRDGARQSLRTSLTMARDSGSAYAVLYALSSAILLRIAEEDDTNAARLCGAQEAGFESMGISIPDPIGRVQERHMAPARARLGEVAWDAALEAGKALTVPEAVDLALGADQ